MPTVRFHLTAGSDHAQSLMSALQSLEGIEHVEEIGDLMPHLDDPDSSSAGLPDDMGPGVHSIEVEAPNELTARRVRELAEAMAHDAGGAIEFVDEF